MDKVPLWKPLLILLVLAFSIAAIIPPGRKLKPGLDLAGGTVFIYQVNVPPGSDAQKDIDDTISVLQNRVDPTGVRNLVWRQLAGHRIEIQMAVASPEASKLREQFAQVRKAMFDQNLSQRDIDAFIKADPKDRAAKLEALTAGNPDRKAALQALAEAEDRVTAALKPQEEAQKKLRKAEADLAALPADAPEAKRKPLADAIKPLQAELTARTRVLLEARKAAREANLRVESTNIKAAELEKVLGAPDRLDSNPKDSKGPKVNLRQAALADLIAAHPGRAEQVKAVVEAYAKYEKIKGPMDDPNDLIELLRSSGVLEFRIAAPATLPNATQYREQLAANGPRSGEGDYLWVPISDDPASFASKPEQLEALRQQPEAYFAQRYGMIAQAYGSKIYLLVGKTRENSLTHDQDVWALNEAFPTQDQLGLPAVGFELDSAGGQLMGTLTANHLQQPMAIVLDGKVMSAPTINDRINGRGVINGGKGGFSEKELTYLVRTLKAGSLKARLSESPISIQKVGAQFGTDNLRSGTIAAVTTFVIVALFMSCYYFIPGIVATFALAANIVITMGAMAVSDSTFTLPGIAGIILTIGMAVDANVLVFERIREELDKKNTARTAIRLGFGKAMATILDTHLTTILTCVILFYVGTADIKGFAVTLGVGLVASLFTAVFCSRVMLDLYLYFTKATKLSMLPVKFPQIHDFFSPNIDWYGKRYIFVGISLVLTIGGAIGVAMRGVDFLDIEFRSGTQVGFRLREGASPISIADVRKRLDQVSESRQAQLKAQRDTLAAQAKGAAGNPQSQAALAALDEKILQASYLAGDRATVVSVGDTVDGGKATGFSIATLATDPNFVTDAVKEAFQDVMSQVRPIAYEGMERTEAGPPYVFPIKGSSLGEIIERPDLRQSVNPDYIGGVAIVLKNLNPAATIAQVRERLESAQFQPEFESIGYHAYELVGLDSADPAEAGAPGSTQGANDEPRYKSVVLMTRDDAFNYAKNPGTISDKGGLADSQWRLVNAALRRDTSLDSVSSFSSQISGTMQQQAIVAIVLGWVMMMGYIWIRFGNLRFGVGALLALIHDVITAVGMGALCYYVYDTAIGHALLLQPFRVNLALVAAVLTLIGYSVNDTIVVFDRIRENRGKLTILTPGLINDSINQTISRTVLTAGTVLIACFCLYVLGGEAVRGFAFIMFVGSVIGCYSSIAVASPLLLVGLKNLDKTGGTGTGSAVPATTTVK